MPTLSATLINSVADSSFATTFFVQNAASNRVNNKPSGRMLKFYWPADVCWRLNGHESLRADGLRARFLPYAWLHRPHNAGCAMLRTKRATILATRKCAKISSRKAISICVALPKLVIDEAKSARLLEIEPNFRQPSRTKIAFIL